MNTQMQYLDAGYERELAMLDNDLSTRYRHESQEISYRQNIIENHEEISHFENIKNQRQQIAQENTKQTQMNLQKLQIKQTQLAEQKKAVQEKKKLIGKLAERLSATWTRVMQDFKTCKAVYVLPETYTKMVSQIATEYQQCTAIISSAMEKNASGLDEKVQLITQKVDMAEQYSKKCDEIIQNLKAEKEKEEKKKKK